jgi:hypothetical protein
LVGASTRHPANNTIKIIKTMTQPSVCRLFSSVREFCTHALGRFILQCLCPLFLLCFLAATGHAQPAFSGITPVHGPLCASSFPIQIVGSNFVAGSYSIELQDWMGIPTYPIAPPVVATPQSLNVQFDLTGLSPGLGTVNITPPGGPTYSFPFTIDPCSGGSGMQVRLFGDSVTSPARPWQYVLSVMNFGPASSTATTVQVDGIPNPEMTLVAPAGSTVVYPTPATQGFTINVPGLASGSSADYVFELTPDFLAVGFTYLLEAAFTSVYIDDVALPIEVVASQDPNDKSGPRNSNGTYCLSKNALLPYTINFENTPGATAPAQRVAITDQLDLSRVDASSFLFGPITFGNQLVIPPFGVNPFTLTVPYDVDGNPLTIDDNLDVEITGILDVNGLITWVFQSIDSTTGMPPSSPLIGFLPANDTPPEGQGSVSFTIFPADGSVNGDIIANSAEIFFDLNASILTGTWQNTIANGPSIISHPEGVNAPFGTTVTFEVVASGVGLTYQWKKSGIDISGETGTTLTLNSIVPSDAGCYTVEVTDCAGTAVLSAIASLNGPLIILQPNNLITCLGSDVSFEVVATGVNLTYQWKKNGSILIDGGNVSGAQGPVLSLTGVDYSDEGSYTVEMPECAWSVTSVNATLAIQSPPELSCTDDKIVECNSVWDFDEPTVISSNTVMTVLSTATSGTGPQLITRTWIATNVCGSVTCSQTVTVDCPSPCPTLLLFNTGVDMNGVVLENEAVDPHYALTDNPNGAGSDAFVVEGNGLANTSTSKWIGPETNGYGVNGGPYTYQITFDLPCTNNVVITGQWAVDNEGAILLNHNATPVATLTGEVVGNFASWHPFTINSGLVVGQNTLAFYVTNQGEGPTALRVELSGNANQCSILTCTTNKTVECGTAWDFDAPTPVSPSTEVMVTSTVTNGSCPRLITRIWTATNACGESVSCTQTVTVAQPLPQLTCFPNKTVECNSVWSFDEPTWTDTCPVDDQVITVTVLSTVTNAIVCSPVVTRTWQVMDVCGNATTCTQTVTVVDTDSPAVVQNLVPNPSFEYRLGCPEDFSQIDRAVLWFQPTLGTPDFFHSCDSEAGFAVPQNTLGHQPAKTGLGYGGGQMFNSTGYREYLATPLLAPLEPGHTYQVSFYVSLAERSRRAVDKIGAYFSVGATTDDTTLHELQFVPQINNTSGTFLSSFDDWMLVSGSYTAVGGENYLTIGNFSNDAETPTIPVEGIGPTPLYFMAYYFVDDVSVIEESTPYLTNKTVSCDSNWDFDVPMVVDNCSGTNVTVTTLSTVTNSGPCPTVITRTWDLSDACGNSVSFSQTVTVVDITPPLLTCVANKTIIADAAWNFDEPAVIDACCSSNVSLTFTSTTNTSDPCKIIFTRTWLATDCCGNANTCSQTVTVLLPATSGAPVISAQPVGGWALLHGSFAFHVRGPCLTSPAKAQWNFKGLDVNAGFSKLVGKTNSTLVLTDVSLAHSGSYFVTLSNQFTPGSLVVNSDVVQFTVYVPPQITIQPANYTGASAKIAGNNALFKITATGTAPLNYQWFHNGSLIPGATASAWTQVNVQAADAGTYSCVVSNISGLTATTLPTKGLLQVPDDVKKPFVSITSPLVNSRLTNGLIYSLGTNSATAPDFIFAGTATDNGLITNVLIERIFPLDALLTTNANLTEILPGNQKWTNNLRLVDGTNTFRVTARDNAGLNSTPVVRNIFHVNTTTPLTLIINAPGSGNITSVGSLALLATFGDSTNQALLEIGRNYTVLATPTGNNIFTNWTILEDSGITTSSTNRLTFRMSSNLTLTANFLLNPMLVAIGKYNGLFYETNGPGIPNIKTHSAGLLRLNVGTGRSFSGTILLDGRSHGWSGVFNLSGDVTKTVSRGVGRPSLFVTMHLDWTVGGSRQISGTISNTDVNDPWMAPLFADLAIYNAGNPTNSNRYTMLIPPGPGAPGSSPGGYGYGLLTNRTDGLILLGGKLADATPITQSVPVSKDGRMPLYVKLYGGRGLLEGWLDFSGGSPAGNLTWIKPTTNRPPSYIAGFTNANVTVSGSAYAKTGAAALGNTNLVVEVTETDLIAGAPLKWNVQLKPNNTFLVVPGFDTATNLLSGFIIANDGSFTLKFRQTLGTFLTDKTARGAVDQAGNIGLGAYSGKIIGAPGITNTGAIYIYPKP